MATDLDGGPNRTIPATIVSVCLIGYVGSMLFFFRMRKSNMQE